MKKIFSTKRIVSLILTIVMVLSLGSTAFANTEKKILNPNSISNDIAAAREAYNALEGEAKAIFEASLANNRELLDFHKTYVDINFNIKVSNNRMMAAAATADAMTLLMQDLNTLGLPSAVLYSLQAMGAGMVAAIADGPLPIGDILLAAATASAVIILAANWDTVYPVLGSITKAFTKAFSTSAANIISAFATVQEDTEKEVVRSAPVIRVNGQLVTIDGAQFACKTRADQLTESQKQMSRYYVAVLYAGTVWVDVTHPAPDSLVRVIMRANNFKIGAWATQQAYARGICGGNYEIWDNSHKSSEGYFFHYHHPAFRNFHCWYL